MPGPGSPVPIALLSLAVLGGVLPAAAQSRPLGVDRSGLDSLGTRLHDFSPRVGPPGTVVTLRGSDLPVEAPLRIGVGALRFGFEDIGWVMSDEDGRFTYEVEIPAWTTWDRAHFFIVFDPYFAPLAVSAAFHVTDPTGAVQRSGITSGGTAGCATLTGADGTAYALEGDLAGVGDGTAITVEGVIAPSAACGATMRIAVRRVLPGPGR